MISLTLAVSDSDTVYFLPGLNLCPQLRQVISTLLEPIPPATAPARLLERNMPAAAFPALKPFLFADREVEPHFGQQATPADLFSAMRCLALDFSDGAI